jgi:hypothetical protein
MNTITILYILSLSFEFNVTVEKPCKPAYLNMSIHHFTHTLGTGNVKLKCKASGDPEPSIFWSPIKDKRFIDNKKGTFTIRKPRVEDTGSYTCTATNECGQESSETELTIKVDGNCSRPSITFISDHKTIKTGSVSVSLYCSATGNPVPSVSWSPIKDENRFTVDTSIDTEASATLTIENPIPKDSGTYECHAVNHCGDDIQETSLTVVCSPFKLLKNGWVRYFHGKQGDYFAEFYCNPEYELFGPNTTRCLSNGEWADILPECLPFRMCPQPKTPKNGRVLSRQLYYEPGDKVIYQCDKGKSNVGASSQTCQENLEWSSPKPNCQQKKKRGKSCGDPGDIENGVRRGQSYSVGDIVYYGCNQGYFLRGQSQLYCQSNGLWSNPPPECELTFEDLKVLAQRYENVLNRTDVCGDDDSEDDQASGHRLDGSFDLIFVLDKSGSVSNNDFKLGLKFVKTVVKQFSSTYDDVRFSIVTYSKHPELVAGSHLRFDNNSKAFFPSSELERVIRSVRRGTYGPTATRRALDVVRDIHVLENRHCYDCTPPTPRPPEKDIYTYPCPSCTIIELDCCSSTLLFLITDGKSNWAGDPKYAARCLKSSGVEIFGVGVTSHINIDELRDIASEPLHQHLYLIRSFDDAVKLVTLAKKRFK